MTQLRQVSISNFRNINSAQLQLSCGLNLLIGDNAAGKTAVIEAIWLLATGRSFRTSQGAQLIQHQAPESVLFAQACSSHDATHTHKFGLQKNPQHTLRRLDGETLASHAPIARHLPIQLLTPESHKLLEEGPKARRQYIDWGCFHQSNEFIEHWRAYQKGLKQRNAALKKHLPMEQVQLWDQTLVTAAEHINSARKAYVEALTPYLITFCQALMPEISTDVDSQYRPGWPKQHPDFAALLKQNINKDQRLGHTQYGPHRADVRFKFDHTEAIHTLSRGQQKLFVCALLLAQASLHEKVVQEPVIMLIDDLPAELDKNHRLKLLELLQILNIQHLITSTSAQLIEVLNPKSSQCWHINAGCITPIEAKLT